MTLMAGLIMVAVLVIKNPIPLKLKELKKIRNYNLLLFILLFFQDDGASLMQLFKSILADQEVAKLIQPWTHRRININH